MTIISDGAMLKIGRDFVEAVTATPVSRGEVAVQHGRVLLWQSTTGMAASEHILREAAAREGRSIVYFMSQSARVAR